jgi:DNA-binding GntR family transcriptional regulator
MSKLQDAIDLMKTAEGSRLSQNEVAESVGCSRAQVRRAQQTITAERRLEGRSDDGDEARRYLTDVLTTYEAEEQIRLALKDLRDEQTEQKARLREIVERRDALAKEARETYPLFETAEKKTKPKLASVG